ncbi:hypothetical protein PRIPAC_83358, partial [Pristionchus pacificus]|uniref:Uncharacterized protein n=1 Tax=Pristionchus pacificus TaxID=54126 RepID=A0A2A6CCQ4_PRIPA
GERIPDEYFTEPEGIPDRGPQPPDNMRAAPNDGAPESLASSPQYAQYDES